MDITYHGHSCFKLKADVGTIITDPFDEYVGLPMASLSADVVTVSHDHPDHNAIKRVKGTVRREKPFIVNEAGEYEVGGISIFGVPSFHDAHQGVERGTNLIFTILVEDIRVCHLGDLGHELSSEQLAEIGPIDVLFCPVGGSFTIDPATAVKVIHSLEPSMVIPMHYQTPGHNKDVFADLKSVEDFLKTYGSEPTSVEKISIQKGRLPEETELVVLQMT